MMTIRIQREGGDISTLTTRTGGIKARAYRQGDISTLAMRTGGIKAKAYRQGGILCRVYQEVRSSLGGPYLEIAPTILWVLAGQSNDNSVYSNTTWNVD